MISVEEVRNLPLVVPIREEMERAGNCILIGDKAGCVMISHVYQPGGGPSILLVASGKDYIDHEAVRFLLGELGAPVYLDKGEADANAPTLLCQWPSETTQQLKNDDPRYCEDRILRACEKYELSQTDERILRDLITTCFVVKRLNMGTDEALSCFAKSASGQAFKNSQKGVQDNIARAHNELVTS